MLITSKGDSMKKIIIFPLLLMVSCGDSSGSGGGGSALDLSGTYKTECISGTKSTRIFSGNTATLSVFFYSDKSCLSQFMNLESMFTFTIGDQLAGLTNTYKIDFTQTLLTIEIKNQPDVDDANKKQLYGYSDWAVDIKKDVAGRVSSSGEKEDANGTVSYKIFKLDGGKYYSSDNATGDGSTPEKRPTSINTTTYGTKQ